MTNTSYFTLFTNCLILLSFTSIQGCEQLNNDETLMQMIKDNNNPTEKLTNLYYDDQNTKTRIDLIYVNGALIDKNRYQQCKQKISDQALQELKDLINDTFYTHSISEQSIKDLVLRINQIDLYKTFTNVLLYKIRHHTPADTTAIDNFKLCMKHININHQECDYLWQAFYAAAYPKAGAHLVKLFINSGLDINRRNKKGQTIFQEQLEVGPFCQDFYIRALDNLFTYGLEINNIDKTGVRASYYAREKNFISLEKALLQKRNSKKIMPLC